MPDLKSRAQLPHLPYPKMNVTRTINAHRAAASGDIPDFGHASRDFDSVLDKVSLPADIFSGLSGFTVAAWVRLDTLGASRNIIGGWPAGSTQILFRMLTSGGMQGYIYTTGQTGGNLNMTVSGGLWEHVALTYDGSTLTGYVDGVAGSTTYSTSGSIRTPSSPAPAIGYAGSSSGYSFDGLCADARIYNRALSSSEIGDLVAGTHVSSGLIGWYLLDTDDVDDYSGEGNDGSTSNTVFSTSGPFD
jgi:hypothetical protein